MAEHNEVGKWGEAFAADYLRQQGYVILERDWRSGPSHRDIDIICKSPDGRTVVFVEVKTRSAEQLRDPEEAVNVRKMRHIGLAADCYVKQCHVVEHLRFDIITIVGRKGGADIQLHHLQDAFNPLLV